MTEDVMSLLRPIGLRTLIDEAIRQVRRNFRTLFLPVAIPMVVAVPPLMVIYMRSISGFVGFDAETRPEDVLALFLRAGVVYVLWMAIYAAGFAAAFLFAMDTLEGRPVAMGRSWFYMFRPKVAWTFFIAFVLWTVSSLMCVVPGIYVGLILSFVLPVMAAEDRFGMQAIKRSARLLHFNPRMKLGDNPAVKVFILFLVGWMLSMGITMAVQLPITVAQQIVLFREAAGGAEPDPIALMERMTWFQVPSAAFGTLASALMYLYLGFGLSLLFFDVRRRREGKDLEAALDELDPRGAKEAGVF